MADSRLRTLLLKLNVTTTELADRLGESRQTVSNWMSRGLPGKQIFAVATALDIPPTELSLYVRGQRVDPKTLIDSEVEAFIDLISKLPEAERIYALSRLFGQMNTPPKS